MESSNTKKDIRNIVIRFAVVFFIVLMVLTFYSKTVEQMLLPAVSTYTPRDENIKNTHCFVGNITYDTTYKEYPEFNYFIEKVLINKGSLLLLGKPIAKLRDIDVEKKRKEYELQILVLEDRITGYNDAIERGLRKSQREATERQLEIAQTELDNLLEEKAQYFKYIDNENNLVCSVEGKVFDMFMTDCSYVSITDPLFEYVKKGTNPVIKWSMPTEKISIYSASSRVRLDYEVYTTDDFGNEIVKTKTETFKVDKMEYDSKNDWCNYTSILPKNQNILDSPKINVTVIAEVQKLKNAVPKSAVEYDEYNNPYIFIVREEYDTKELVAKETVVKIKEDYGTHYQIDYAFNYGDSVVISTTKELSHNTRVKLR